MENINVTLKRLRKPYLNNITFPYLNINSIRNKFDDLIKIMEDNIDILAIAEMGIAETKLDDSLPNNQLILEGYHIDWI